MKEPEEPLDTALEIPTVHWADQAAERLLAQSPDQSVYVCASGISPSGVVHIGNFREVITVDFVVRSLRRHNKNVRAIHSWDDYDALRKVPKNLPQPELIEKNLRRPISRVPDPFGTDASYAAHFEKLFEAEIAQLGIFPEFIYQQKAYESGKYLKGIQTALKATNAIRAVLDTARTEGLDGNWTCITIYCGECDRDTTKVLEYKEPSIFRYSCTACKKEFQIDMAETPGVKLLWRVDWPMRWAFEKVDFEPGGKDHSSTGGSFETGSEIIRKVYQREPPMYVRYDFVLTKGLGAKLSSSAGNFITLTQALEVYEPQVLRWIFASRKPNLDFSISFDLDVMKAYDDFDRCERIAGGLEEADEKKRNYEACIYEFSKVNSAIKEIPKLQYGFRHLCNILQIHQGNLDRVSAHYNVPESEIKRFRNRTTRAWKWITEYAPPEFRFQLRKPGSLATKTSLLDPVNDLVQLLTGLKFEEVTEDAMTTQIFEITKKYSLQPKDFFAAVYQALIGKNNGPKLANFLKAMGKETAVKLLKEAV